jgi:hypothetical protein
MARYSQEPEGVMAGLGLSEEQKHAVRTGDLYRVRRLASSEMTESLHAQLLTRFHEANDPNFRSGRAWTWKWYERSGLNRRRTRPPPNTVLALMGQAVPSSSIGHRTDW